MRHRALAALCALFPTSSAYAFCGLYVSEEGTTIENHASQVIFANHDGLTTITIAADFSGDASDFGLLVPIPSVITAGDVRVVSPDLFTNLDAYTLPRLVHYPPPGDDTDADSDADTDSDTDTDTDQDVDADVVVEERFTVGDYDIAILSTDDATALTAWLTANGFAGPEDRDGILQGYVDNGQHFLAAKVAVGTLTTTQAWLPPLQFSYPGEPRKLPIRIGTLSASGEQELVIYGITDADFGQLAIANYPEARVVDECLWRGNDLDAWYQERLDDAFGGEAAWLREYAIPVIGQGWCDPCTTNAPLFVQDLAAYGWDGATYSYNGYYGYYSGSAYLTRLRVRYTPEQALEDLEFDGRGQLPLDQVRYIADEVYLRDLYPQCDDLPREELDWPEGTGPDDPENGGAGGGGGFRVGRGCASVGGSDLVLIGLGALLVAIAPRRRNSR